MMSSEEDTECFGLYDKLLINTNSSEKNLVGAGINSLIVSNSNSNSSSIISNSSITNKKCNRQHVHVVGEQRNSCYSSIPNFSFRPSSFMSSASAGTAGLYGTLLNQTQSAHFVGGLFGPNGFGSAKMLNEILGRQMKQAQDATSGLPISLVDNVMLTAAMESATSVDLLSASIDSSFNSSKLLNNNCMTYSSIENNASGGGGGGCNSGGSILNNNNHSISSNSTPVDTGESLKEVCGGLDESESVSPKQQQTVAIQQQHKQQQNNLAHHMLRNILQGKKDLIALDQELRSVINHHKNSENLKQNTSGGCSDDVVSQDSNNFNSKNKNNTSVTNNNNNGSTNRNLGNTCENRLTPAGVSSNSKGITRSCSKSAISNLIGSVGELMNTLGSCSDVQIKSEPIAPNSPTNVGNNICTLNAEPKNKSENSGRVSKNSLGKKTSSESLNADERAAVSEGTDEYNFSEMQQPQQISQSECRSLTNDIVTKTEAEDLLEEEIMVLSSRSDLESIGSPNNSDINDMMLSSEKDRVEEIAKDGDSTIDKAAVSLKPIVLDMKRARVENIVSSMQSSPSSHYHMNMQVNGCKKRKLYQPQQHAMERYAAAAAGLNFGLNMQSLILEEEDEEDIESPQIQQKRVQKNVLKSQLRTMQEQLAEMQQKYVQLCSRMEQESECQEVDDTASDSLENDGNHGAISPALSLTNSTHITSLQRPLSISPPLYPPKPKSHGSVKPAIANSPPMLAQIMSKMISAKVHSPIVEQTHLQQTFNQKSSLLQNKPHVTEDHNIHVTHSGISNAAAMYLGQHFLLEHEVRIAKETAEQHERQQQQQQHKLQQQQKEQQQKQHENQRRFEQEQKESLLKQKQQHQRHQNQHKEAHQLRHQAVDVRLSESQTAASLGNHLLPSHSHQRLQQPQQRHTNTSTQSSIKSEISEKFNMLRSHSSSTVRMSGSDLEGLADVLKSEITTSLSALVDTIVTRFVHQRRLFNKQSQSVAAAADQLNKDLMMASHILDRKSPRPKVSDQLSSNSMPNVPASLVNTSVTNMISSQSGNSLLLNTNKKQTISTNSSLCNISSTISSHPSDLVLTNHLTNANENHSCSIHIAGPRTNNINLAFASPSGMGMQVQHATSMNSNLNQSDKSCSNNLKPLHLRSSPSAAIFQAPKTPQSMSSVAAVSLYNSIGIGGSGNGSHTNPMNPFCMSEPREQNVEQNEALSLVVTPKKKRHKVTDTRITPRTVSRILAQDGVVGPNVGHNLASDSNLVQNPSSQQNTFNQTPPVSNTVSNSIISVAPASTTPSKNSSPRPNPYHPPVPPMMSVSLPTSVAIANPSLHESQVFSPYSPFFNPHHGPPGSSHLPPAAAQMHHMKISSSPPGLGSMVEGRDSPPLPHPPTMIHPALLVTAHHGNSPDYSAHLRAAMDAQDRNSDCNSGDLQFDGIQPTIKSDSLTPLHSSTLTPMHLRKAKLMFFWVRYPSSAVLKMYFPDIKFNKNNTAQLVKWFSNFREFYYIQMEKYARQAVTEGVKNGEDLHVGGDSELYRVLNLHYNRNNHIEVPSNFRFVVEQTLREFFRAIQGGKDTEQSWKKSIYKVISRMDDPVPEYFKSPNFLEQLE